MTSSRYAGFENENSYRNYPFSESADLHDVSGAPFATDVFVDAFLYPVSSVQTGLALSVVDFGKGGLVEVALSETGEVLSGTGADGTVELYDYSGRHAGTLACGPGWNREIRSARRMEFEGLRFAPSVTAVVVHDGVMGFDAGGATAAGRIVELVGDGCVTPVLSDTALGPELSFDVQDDSVVERSPVVRRIVFVVAGRTIFDVERQSDNAVLLTTPMLDREDVCWRAHAEDSVAAVADTCPDSNDLPSCPRESVPFSLKEIVVKPSDTGCINIVADDVIGFKNPVMVSTMEGRMRMNSPQMRSDVGESSMVLEASKLLTRQIQAGNGIRIGIPGLGNGG